MRFVVAVLVLGLLGCAGAAGPTVAPTVEDYQTPGAIVGIVSVGAASGEPLAGVTVSLVGEGAGVSLSTMTDAHGQFAFEGIAPGHYVVQAEHHDAGRAVVVQLPAGRGQRVNLALQPDLLLL